jgi:hypothetical protein
MSVDFPNRSRSFDEMRDAVRFIGYDGMFEVRFFVEADALATPTVGSGDPDAREAACLSAFDARRQSIYDAASRAHAGKRQDIHTLTADNFR